MKNKLIDLNNHLFAQMERLDNENLKGELLFAELNRAKSVTGVAHAIVANARLALDATKMADNFNNIETPLPAMIDDNREAK